MAHDKDIQDSLDDLDDNPLKRGRLLERSLLGPPVATDYHVFRMHNGRSEGDLTSLPDKPDAIAIVKGEIDELEREAETSKDANFVSEHKDMTTNPKEPFVASCRNFLCKVLGEKPESKMVRYYNTLGTVLDRWQRTDFMIEFDPSCLPVEKFGEEVRSLTEPIFVSVDLTLRGEKEYRDETIVVDIYDEVPDQDKERRKRGEDAARKILYKLTKINLRKKFGEKYNPPILDELEQHRQDARYPKPSGDVEERIRPTVIKRVKKVMGGGTP